MIPKIFIDIEKKNSFENFSIFEKNWEKKNLSLKMIFPFRNEKISTEIEFFISSFKKMKSRLIFY